MIGGEMRCITRIRCLLLRHGMVMRVSPHRRILINESRVMSITIVQAHHPEVANYFLGFQLVIRSSQ